MKAATVSLKFLHFIYMCLGTGVSRFPEAVKPGCWPMDGSIWGLAGRGQVAAADRGREFAVLAAVLVDGLHVGESVVVPKSRKEGVSPP